MDFLYTFLRFFFHPHSSFSVQAALSINVLIVIIERRVEEIQVPVDDPYKNSGIVYSKSETGLICGMMVSSCGYVL